MITVFSLPVCPKCKLLKAYLAANKIPYQEASLEDAGTIAEMRCSGFFGMSAPVIGVAEGYYGPEEFFDGEKLNEEKLRRLL